MRIFVNIASYRDPLLYNTIMSLEENKSGLHRIEYGIFEQIQYEDSLAAKHPKLLENDNIRYKRIDPEYSEGVGWARKVNSLQMMYSDFYYQIDSHMLFDPNWDDELIADYNLAVEKYNTPKVIITASCKDFYLLEDGKIIKQEGAVTCKSTYYKIDNDYRPSAIGEHIPATETITDAIHIFAGNMFTHADWVKEIGPNPKIYFNGEEHHLTLTSFMAEYRLCHPRKMTCYHYHGSNDYITKHWIQPVISDKQHQRSVFVSGIEYRNFLRDIDYDWFEKYRKYSGVDYLHKKIEKRAHSTVIPAPPDNDWLIPDRLD